MESVPPRSHAARASAPATLITTAPVRPSPAPRHRHSTRRDADAEERRAEDVGAEGADHAKQIREIRGEDREQGGEGLFHDGVDSEK